ncbi:hypothetical protein BKA67DRAFT_664057 [Truncatella angustata]|uniref:Uncharacterized protein n=1 Tax=Truncatella angustata TaxID=152316 RepID=A0A9P8U9E2_9PEZI|nr:uncharacterized protein BKA67DRAFT_664057 [Truncatella angustata]KAH6646204.1 hypothetical protein BKA67DRAFT_664057 [Truncatella angustata]
MAQDSFAAQYNLRDDMRDLMQTIMEHYNHYHHLGNNKHTPCVGKTNNDKALYFLDKLLAMDWGNISEAQIKRIRCLITRLETIHYYDVVASHCHPDLANVHEASHERGANADAHQREVMIGAEGHRDKELEKAFKHLEKVGDNIKQKFEEGKQQVEEAAIIMRSAKVNSEKLKEILALFNSDTE